MREEMRAYFRGERREAMLHVVVAVGSVAAAVQLRRVGSPHVAAGIPLALFALVQLVVGVKGWPRARRLAEERAVLLAGDPGRYQHDELARLGPMHAHFRVTLGIETLLIVAGLLCAFLLRDDATWLGVGAAVAIEAALLLALDAAALIRSRAYVAALGAFLTDAGARETTVETAE